MDPEYRYYAISLRENEVGVGPTQVCRRRVDDTGETHDELYLTGSGWVPTTELTDAQSGDRGTKATELSPGTAEVFIDVQDGRPASFEPKDGKYTYYAWMDDDKFSVDDARGVIRTWTSPQGYRMENKYTFDEGWVRSYLRQDVDTDRKSGRLKEITEEEAARFKEIVDARRWQA
ncbi:hypothetical protein [Lentzea californiensis]|uniref:hypothetical protein n=1 Tax=Lentzea californiensis TaxID=438851 RepID=UPI00216620FB|nr:hypothetical protein [Lentzea californiensis]